MYGVRLCGRITMVIYVNMWSHMLNYVPFLVSNMFNEYRDPRKFTNKSHPMWGFYPDINNNKSY